MRDRAILFDLDGTLLDTIADLGASTNAALELLAAPTHPLARYKDFVGAGIAELVTRALPEGRRQPAEINRCIELTRNEYGRRFLDQSHPYPGVRELLTALSARRVPFAVLSNKPHDFTVRMVEALLPFNFTVVAGARPEVPLKPDPTAALSIVAAMDALPARCLFVGDSDIDMQTARNAGMHPVGVSWGFRPVAELREHGAAAILDRPADLLALLA